MTTIPIRNPVPFKYEPIGGDLYLDHFRVNFYMERLGDVRKALQLASFDYETVAEDIEGEILFWDDDRPPEIHVDAPFAETIRLSPPAKGGEQPP